MRAPTAGSPSGRSTMPIRRSRGSRVEPTVGLGFAGRATGGSTWSAGGWTGGVNDTAWRRTSHGSVGAGGRGPELSRPPEATRPTSEASAHAISASSQAGPVGEPGIRWLSRAARCPRLRAALFLLALLRLGLVALERVGHADPGAPGVLQGEEIHAELLLQRLARRLLLLEVDHQLAHDAGVLGQEVVVER